ncbi:MAG: hypothetical protein ABFD79_07195 [Phycisphaerales bacterium]
MELKNVSFFLASVVFFFFVNHLANATDPNLAVIVNHTCTDITAIPQSAIERAKASLHIAYGHTSHGSQLITGMNGLIAFANAGGKGLALPANIFAWSYGGDPAQLDLHDYAMGGDVGYYPDWVDNTVNYLGPVNPSTGRGTTHPETNVIIWSWCGQISSKYSSGTLQSEYLTPMSQLEATYPGISFVYMTGHLDHSVDAANKAANQMVRDYCIANKKVLFDFADIESYDPDGVYYQFADDGCNYYASATSGTVLGNWATQWQNTHTQGVDWFNCTPAHTEALNGNLKGFAAWWLWAWLGGWNGCSVEIAGDISDDCKVNFSDFAILAQNWQTENPLGDVAPPPNGNGFIDFQDLAVIAQNWLDYAE